MILAGVLYELERAELPKVLADHTQKHGRPAHISLPPGWPVPDGVVAVSQMPKRHVWLEIGDAE